MNESKNKKSNVAYLVVRREKEAKVTGDFFYRMTNHGKRHIIGRKKTRPKMGVVVFVHFGELDEATC